MNYLVPSFPRPCSDSKEVVMKHKATLNPNDNLDQKLKKANKKRKLLEKPFLTICRYDPFRAYTH